MGRGSGRASGAGLVSAAAFLATGKVPNLASLAAPATLGTSLCTGGLRPAHRHGEGRAGQKKDLPLDVCPGSNSQYPLNGDPWPYTALIPILTPPNTQTQMLPPPNSCRQTRGVAPNLLALLPLSQAGQRVVKGKGDTQVALLSDFHSRATVPLLTHRSQILPPHLPPPHPTPWPNLSYIQEGKIL